MEPSIDQLMKRYRNMSDEEIELLAYYQVKTLTPEALIILEGEIKRRSLTQDFQAIVDIQEKGLADEELDELIDAISSLPCPICFSKEKRLNASKIAIAKSAILVTTIDDPLLIACPDCIVSGAKSATKKNTAIRMVGYSVGSNKDFSSIID